MSTTALSEILASVEHEADGLRFPVPAGWKQGRTAFGGFTGALLLAAAQTKHADLPPLRSALINFTAPITEPPIIGTELLRQGRNVTTVQARAEIAGKPAALATFAFGHPQDSEITLDLPAPTSPAPEDTPALPVTATLPVAAFFANFDFRPVEGGLPFSGAERGYLRAWVRHNDPAMYDSLPGLIAIADILPPAVFPMLRTPGPNSSMNWICNILAETPRTRDGWWLVESEISAGANGYSSQVMRIWNTDGELVVDGMQSVVIFV
ncbi:MAG: thioesterase family protein [Mangrovicoccus sp.]|nr:thioesterase family protein [Mangrovicoccus sp.]